MKIEGACHTVISECPFKCSQSGFIFYSFFYSQFALHKIKKSQVGMYLFESVTFIVISTIVTKVNTIDHRLQLHKIYKSIYCPNMVQTLLVYGVVKSYDFFCYTLNYFCYSASSNPSLPKSSCRLFFPCMYGCHFEFKMADLYRDRVMGPKCKKVIDLCTFLIKNDLIKICRVIYQIVRMTPGIPKMKIFT